jgi:hypothetical protein
MALGPVGFDLDLTLIDSRPQILASFRALSDETGAAIDVDVIFGERDRLAVVARVLRRADRDLGLNSRACHYRRRPRRRHGGADGRRDGQDRQPAGNVARGDVGQHTHWRAPG